MRYTLHLAAACFVTMGFFAMGLPVRSQQSTSTPPQTQPANPAPAQGAPGDAQAAQTGRYPPPSSSSVHAGRSPGGDVGSGAGDIGKGTADGAGNVAKGTGKGAADLVTLHPVNAAGDLGKGAAVGGKDIAVGAGKGTGKIVKGTGRGIGHIFHHDHKDSTTPPPDSQ